MTGDPKTAGDAQLTPAQDWLDATFGPGGATAADGPPERRQSGEALGFPQYTDRERFVDAIVHVLGVFLSIAGVSAMITLSAIYSDAATVASLAVYGAGMIIVFATSALYHFIESPTWKQRLRRLDHAAIFIKIAGTYTPFAVVSIGGGWGVAILSAVWTIAAIGVPLKLFAPDRVEKIAVALYLFQGWLMLLAIGAPFDLPTASFILLLCGGACYTIGVAFHLWRKLPFQNAIWHMFVLAGSMCMYAAILIGVAFH